MSKEKTAIPDDKIILLRGGLALLLLGLAVGYAWLYGLLGSGGIPSIPRRLLVYPGLGLLYGGAVGLVGRSRLASQAARADLGLLLLGAVLLRGIILVGAVPPNPDLGRYLWEGKVLLAGFNPYAAPPNSSRYDSLRAQLTAQRDPLYSGFWTRYAGMRSVYGPVATLLFALPHLLPFDRVLTFRALMTGFDFLTVLLLIGVARTRNRSPSWVIIYAWSPVVLNGFADRGQVDAVMVFLVVLAWWALLRQQSAWAGLAMAGALLTKISPLLLVFPLWRVGGKRFGIPFLAALGIGLLPVAAAGWEGLQGWAAFAERWSQNDALFSLFRGLLRPWEGVVNIDRLVRVGVAAMALLYALERTRRLREAEVEGLGEALVSISVAVILLSPVTFPWYTALLPAFLCFHPRVSWLLLSAAPMGWYLNFLPVLPGFPWHLLRQALDRWGQFWRFPAYGTVLAVAFWESHRKRRKS